MSSPETTAIGLQQPLRRRARAPVSAPSLADVARAAGVSTASASRALTRPDLVSAAVKESVLEAVSGLGYVANAAARSLSTRRSSLVGAVVCNPDDPIVVPMLAAAEERFSAHGLGLAVRVASASASAAACAQALIARGVDALLFIGTGPAVDATAWSGNRVVPFVGCGQKPKVGGDEVAGETIEQRGLKLARAYLEQLGHRRIGVIRQRRGDGTDPPASTSESEARNEQQVDRLQDVDAVQAAVRLLVANEASGIVAMGDAAAAAALLECRRLKLAVPQQISVVGWGDSALARCLEPQLTSVRIPAHASGQAAAEYLVAALGGRGYQWPELLLKVVVRGSSGPASG